MRPQKRRRNPSSKAAISTASTPKKAKSSKRPEKPSETGQAMLCRSMMSTQGIPSSG